MTRHRELLESPLLARRAAIFTDAERVIADPVVRNRGTIGGALCQADPSEDLSAVCAAVGARMVIRGPGRRARGRHARVPPRALSHRGRGRRAAGRDPGAARRRHRQRLREGRSPGRRLGGGRRRRLADARRRRASPRPGSRWPRSAPTSPAPRPSVAAGPRARRRASWSAAARLAAQRLPAGDRSARIGRVQAPRGRGARPPGPCSGRRSAPARRGDAGDGRGQRRGAHARCRVRGCCWCISCATSSG